MIPHYDPNYPVNPETGQKWYSWVELLNCGPKQTKIFFGHRWGGHFNVTSCRWWSMCARISSLASITACGCVLLPCANSGKPWAPHRICPPSCRGCCGRNSWCWCSTVPRARWRVPALSSFSSARRRTGHEILDGGHGEAPQSWAFSGAKQSRSLPKTCSIRGQNSRIARKPLERQTSGETPGPLCHGASFRGNP